MTERPKYNRLVNEVHANGGFAGDTLTDEPAAQRPPDNPHLTALSIGGSIAVILGVVLWATRLEIELESESGRIVLDVAVAGTVLFWLGAGLLIGWLTASAVCWQLRQPPSA